MQFVKRQIQVRVGGCAQLYGFIQRYRLNVPASAGNDIIRRWAEDKMIGNDGNTAVAAVACRVDGVKPGGGGTRIDYERSTRPGSQVDLAALSGQFRSG